MVAASPRKRSIVGGWIDQSPSQSVAMRRDYDQQGEIRNPQKIPPKATEKLATW